MKTPLLFIFLLSGLYGSAQITSPVIRAFFGVDGDLRANSFNGSVQSSDDWYTNGTSGTGRFVIDTTGAWAIRNGYATDVSPFPRRMASFFRTMSQPSFSVINNRLWLDALFVRDYHGNDTTVFIAGKDKNGMSPETWSGGVQGIPDKNDILDMFMHVRRAGPNTTDSLWFFGGLSLDNVTGNRYFDFEMYQTDIYYDRASGKWYGYGPDAGHTSWKFDADGKVTTPGDIIFSAEYQSSSLTSIEARIWVHRDALNITPTSFTWSGNFDGADNGATYGYASIVPKTDGAFYTGLQCGSNEWAGPFNLVLQDNSLETHYMGKQFMEFSVNLTKLGLDPVTVFGTDICGTPFNRIVVKTRASASFTAELKDFVAPTDLFLAARVQALAEVPEICGAIGSSRLSVTNPVSSSVYSWSTTDGLINGSTEGPEVYAEKDGTYIVTQRLNANCGAYATDTVVVRFDETCALLNSKGIQLKGALQGRYPQLKWSIEVNDKVAGYEVERSTNGYLFETVHHQANVWPGREEAAYSYLDAGVNLNGSSITYRIKIKFKNGSYLYSTQVSVTVPLEESLRLFPNPASQSSELILTTARKGMAWVQVIGLSGVPVHTARYMVKAGVNNLQALPVYQWPEGVYLVRITTAGGQFLQKLVVRRDGRTIK